jgi:hypothetical protein
VGELLRVGWRHADIVNALEATMNEAGEEDIDVAHAHLENLREWRQANANSNAASNAAGEEEETPERIRAGGELAEYIAVNPDLIDVVLRMMELHEKSRNAHHAEHFRTAANLAAHPRLLSDPVTSSVPLYAIKKIALAVVNDCSECEKLRAAERAKKQEQQERAKKAADLKAKEAAAKQAAEAAKLRKESEEREKREAEDAKRPRTPPLPDDEEDADGVEDFDPSDSKWAKKKSGGICWECKKGIENGVLLHGCETCKHPYHKRCMKFGRIRKGTGVSEQTKWACLHCLRRLQPGWRAIGKATNVFPESDSDSEPESHKTPSRNRPPRRRRRGCDAHRKPPPQIGFCRRRRRHPRGYP